MHFLRSFLLSLSLALPAVAAKKPKADSVPPPPPPRTQDAVAMDFIYHVLTGNVDSTALLFEASMRDKVTKEAVEGIQGQFKWLYNFIRGDFEPFFSGQLDSSYFREYRMSNESNKKYPLILIHLQFPDSTTPVLIGAQVKSFLGGNEKRVTGEHTWIVDGRTYEIHSIVAAEIQDGNIMAVQYYDEDTADLTHESVARNGIPLALEAIKRGFKDSARVALEGKPLVEDVGVVFIRKDRTQGFIHAKVSFRPEDLGLARADSTASKTPKTSKTNGKEGSGKKKSEGKGKKD